MSVLFSCSDPDASGQVPADCAQRCQQALPQVQPLLPPGCAKCQSVKSVVEVGGCGPRAGGGADFRDGRSEHRGA